MANCYLTIDGVFENLIVIEKSKFICYIKGIESEDDAKAFVEEIKKKNSMATHNCYAYIADENGLIKKFSDDGEPQGTAGLPMLEALSNNNLKKVVCVVTRYFGGIKLGTGGLNRAYGNSVSECIKIANKVNYELSVNCVLRCKYDMLKPFQKLIQNKKIVVSNIDYSDNVKVEFYLPINDFEVFNNNILELFNGEKVLEKIKESYSIYRC